jgi:hypothetical protein
VDRLGYRANFMRAAAFGQCELIAFADQDDVWFPQKLKKCAAVFEHEDVSSLSG